MSPSQGIPWTKVEYFDNGIICNLIEHVSGCFLTPGSALSRLPENPHPTPQFPSPPLSPFKRERDSSGLRGHQ